MSPLLRHGFAALVSLVGTAAVTLLVLTMNGGTLEKSDDGDDAATTFQVEPQKKKKPKPQRKPKPKPKPKSSKPPPPTPMIGGNLSGLAFGLEGLEGLGPDSDLSALIGDVGNVVMTEEAVDDPPVPVHQVAPEIPPRAIQKGITGRVTLSMLVTSEGNVSDVKVVEAQPPGVFEESATAAVRQWRFQPAQYEGRPVSIRVSQTLRFGKG